MLFSRRGDFQKKHVSCLNILYIRISNMLFLREGCCSTLRCAALAEPFVPNSKYAFGEISEVSAERKSKIPLNFARIEKLST